ncbi:MAG TPA: hypothetical protein VJ385_17540 [Fibrobacteria bacterium]|nr:hypothetical protein [Fibrobacteria bacterium]
MASGQPASALIAEMPGEFEMRGTFGEVGNFLAWNQISKAGEISGFSERFLPGRRYNQSYDEGGWACS